MTDDLERTAASVRQALSLRPDAPDLVLALGMLEQRLGHHDAARRLLEKACVLQPDGVEAWSSLGQALARLERVEEAIVAFERAVMLQPDLPATRRNLAVALGELGNLRLGQGRAAEALVAFERVIALDPAVPHAQHNRGVALQALERFAEAAAAFRAVLERDPRELRAHNDLCICLMRLGDPAAALAACERYLAVSPANRKPLAYKAAALIELGRRDEAAELLDFDRLLLRHRVTTPAGFGSLAAFNAALAGFVLRHPSLAYEPPDKATRGGYQSGELMVPLAAGTANDAEALRAADALKRAIRTAVLQFQAQLRGTLPEHPYTAHLPRRWKLATWAVVLEAQGHQGPHFHPDGYVSGVYYIQLPSVMKDVGDDAGCIEFGRTADAIGGAREPLIEVVRPEEGLMLLFPSYLYHRTLPFTGVEPRICIAFDILPDGDGR